MKKLLKPARIGFYFLMLLAFFIVGLFFADLIDAGKNQGLAGGAIVFGWGVLFSGIAFIASFFVAYYLEVKKIIILNWLLFAFIVIAVGYKYYQFQERDARQKERNEPYQNQSNTPTKTVSSSQETALKYPGALALKTDYIPSEKTDQSMGIGFFSPNFYENQTIYFYGNINLQKGITEHIPVDSIVFARDKYENFIITYAPPWLVPEIMKLDYGVLSFKAEAVGYEFVQVEVNAQNGQIAYLDKNAGQLLHWPDFLLSINSVEFIDKQQVVRYKPLSYASTVTSSFDFMEPILVKEDWMYVVLLSNGRKDMGKGWIQWRKQGQLLIRYSLFS